MDNKARSIGPAVFGLVVAVALVSACATTRPIEPGNWTMQSPDGTNELVEIRLLREDEYYLNAPGNPISGVYKLTQTDLKIVRPDNPRMSGLVWQLNPDRTLTLVQETSVQISGRRLVSATLVKQP